MSAGWIGVIRQEGVPILIVVVLLFLYAFLTITQTALGDHLETMTAMVVAFYFGGKTVTATAETVRSTAASIRHEQDVQATDTATGGGR